MHLTHFVRGGECGVGSQFCSREDGFETGGYLTFNNSFVAFFETVLVIFEEQIPEYFFVEFGDAFEVIGTPCFTVDNVINKSVDVVVEFSQFLLPLQFEFEVEDVLTDLQFECFKVGA